MAIISGAAVEENLQNKILLIVPLFLKAPRMCSNQAVFL